MKPTKNQAEQVLGGYITISRLTRYFRISYQEAGKLMEKWRKEK